jgi:IS30 family transposase
MGYKAKISHIWMDEQRNKIAYLLQAGATIGDIALELQISYDIVKHEIERCGGKNKYDPAIAKQNDGSHLTLHRPFTEEEQAKIKAWVEEGRSIGWMRMQLRCGNQRLCKYLRQDDLDPNRLSLQMLLKRISSIEEHIKIIYEMLEVK